MKNTLLVLITLFSLSSFAKTGETHLVDICGTLTKMSNDAYTLTADNPEKDSYTLVSSEDTSLNQLVKIIPASNRMCIRAEVFSSEPKKLYLFDYWNYMRREYIANCLVSRVVDDNVFEEGLSVHEYPDVYALSTLESESQDNPVGLSLQIAMAASFTEAKGDQLKLNSNPQYRSIMAISKDGKESAEINVNLKHTAIRKGKRVKQVRLGELYYDGKLIAKLHCD